MIDLLQSMCLNWKN